MISSKLFYLLIMSRMDQLTLFFDDNSLEGGSTLRPHIGMDGSSAPQLAAFVAASGVLEPSAVPQSAPVVAPSSGVPSSPPAENKDVHADDASGPPPAVFIATGGISKPFDVPRSASASAQSLGMPASVPEVEVSLPGELPAHEKARGVDGESGPPPAPFIATGGVLKLSAVSQSAPAVAPSSGVPSSPAENEDVHADDSSGPPPAAFVAAGGTLELFAVPQSAPGAVAPSSGVLASALSPAENEDVQSGGMSGPQPATSLEAGGELDVGQAELPPVYQRVTLGQWFIIIITPWIVKVEAAQRRFTEVEAPLLLNEFRGNGAICFDRTVERRHHPLNTSVVKINSLRLAFKDRVQRDAVRAILESQKNIRRIHSVNIGEMSATVESKYTGFCDLPYLDRVYSFARSQEELDALLSIAPNVVDSELSYTYALGAYDVFPPIQGDEHVVSRSRLMDKAEFDVAWLTTRLSNMPFSNEEGALYLRRFHIMLLCHSGRTKSRKHCTVPIWRAPGPMGSIFRQLVAWIQEDPQAAGGDVAIQRGIGHRSEECFGPMRRGGDRWAFTLEMELEAPRFLRPPN